MMNRNLGLAILFIACAVMNFLNVVLSGNGFSLVLGGIWLAGSVLMYARYRKEKQGDTQGEKNG